MHVGFDARKLHDFGIGRYIRELLAAIVELDEGVRITAIVQPGDEDTPDLPASIRRVPCPAGLYSLSELVELSLLARLEEFDVYHAAHYVVPIGLPCPAVVTIHDLIHLRLAHLFGRIKPLVARLLIQHAARSEAILTVSNVSAQDLVTIGGIDPDRIHVTPNAVNERFFRAPDPGLRREIRERLGFADPFLLCVSTHRPHKNLALLVQALAEVQPDHHLVITTPHAEELAALARERGVADRLHMIGFVGEDELPALYHEASVFVFPSLYEGFGLPPLEAAASGVPVVAARAPYLAELLDDAALYADATDAHEFAVCINAILGDTELRARLSADGLRQARKFSWADTARKTLDVYESVVTGSWCSGYGEQARIV